jgi:ubiquinone/menaquinone biosynthesis C-methylase UbiE
MIKRPFFGVHNNQIGYHSIQNIDFSEECITYMRERCKALQGMEWTTMDATRMEFPVAAFDVVLDKELLRRRITNVGDFIFVIGLQGTTDAIMCSNTWPRIIPRLVAEVHRVLRPGGLWIVISFSDERKPYRTSGWNWFFFFLFFGPLINP